MLNLNSKLNEEPQSGCTMVPPPASQQFCLKWNDHSFNLVKTFSSMAHDQNFVDVTLACEGSSIKAHKVVLSACSNYFKELFLANPCKHPIVILKDMKMDDLKGIVDFMYKGEVNVYQHQLGALLKTAEILKVKGLTEAKDDNDNSKLNQEMREMDKENEPVNNELPRSNVDHSSILNETECHINGVSSASHYQSSSLQPLSEHLAPQQQQPIQQITQHQHQPTQPQQQPLSLSQHQPLTAQSQIPSNIQAHINQQTQPQPPQALSPVPQQPPTSQPKHQPQSSPPQAQIPVSSSQPQPQIQHQPLTPPQSHQLSPQIKQDTEVLQQIHAAQLATQPPPPPPPPPPPQQLEHQQPQEQQTLSQQQLKNQPSQPRKKRRRRSKRSADSTSIEEGSASEDISGSASGDDDSASGDNSVTKRLKAPVPPPPPPPQQPPQPPQGNNSGPDNNSNHSLASSTRRRQQIALPPPPPPPIVNATIQSHRELVNNNDYGHLDDSSETWQDGEQISMNNPMGDASEESNGMIDIKPIVSFDEGSVGASMNNMSVSSENMIVSHMDYPSLSPGSTGSTPSNASNTGKICRCQHCGLTFTAYSSLRRHMQRHYADRERYVCDICLKSYSRKDYLKEHRKLKHPT